MHAYLHSVRVLPHTASLLARISDESVTTRERSRPLRAGLCVCVCVCVDRVLSPYSVRSLQWRKSSRLRHHPMAHRLQERRSQHRLSVHMVSQLSTHCSNTLQWCSALFTCGDHAHSAVHGTCTCLSSVHMPVCMCVCVCVCTALRRSSGGDSDAHSVDTDTVQTSSDQLRQTRRSSSAASVAETQSAASVSEATSQSASEVCAYMHCAHMPSKALMYTLLPYCKLASLPHCEVGS